MFPWLWIWAPHLALPLSGDVSQDIEPSMRWFFGNILPEAGNAKIEQRAFAVASYGRQLGLITDLLIELAETSLPGAGNSHTTLQELKRLRAEIEKVKDEEYEAQLRELESSVRAITRRGGPRAKRAAQQLRPLLTRDA